MNTTIDYIHTIYLGFFVFISLFAFFINTILLKFSKTLGIRNSEQATIRWASTTKPALGGIGFFICFLLALSLYSLLFPQHILFSIQLLGIVLAATMAFLMGLGDDAYNTRPIIKFSVQLSCGLILIVTGTHINITTLPYVNYLITLIWIVGIMNAINMLDNMDAIATLTSLLICISGLLYYCIHDELHTVYAFLLLSVIASLTIFLYFNWKPSKMYMGDTGSQFIGLLLAVIGINCGWNATDGSGTIVVSKSIVVILLTFIIPICDTATVIINRISKGQSPFIGGKDHTTHHLFYKGISERVIALLFAIISSISIVFNYIILNRIFSWNYLHILLFSAYFFSIFGVLFYTTRSKS